ncbi:MAG TPA: thioredoxin domain-containing protein [Terriglobia bacterium]|nr:thioredoxin domain-containing protein [Terriglobia bacterium]
MIKRHWKKLIAVAGLVSLLSVVLVASQTTRKSAKMSESATEQKIIHYVRERFGIPDAAKLVVAPFQDSEYHDFFQTTIYVDNGKRKSAQRAFITKDGHYMVIGNIYALNTDPRKEVEHSISLRGQPSVGPANAPVTIVEYADLECPMCARMQQFLEQEVVPKYGNRVRIVFKEFPLVAIHDWALTAAIANQCSYELNPSLYFRYRSMIFKNQSTINGANVRTLLLDFGQRSGLNRLRLATCIDSKQSLPRVEADMREGQQLGISSTPTLFVNGQPVVGMPSPAQFYKLLDQTLSNAK